VRRLRYTRPARVDLEAVLDYNAARSPQGARRVQASIQGVIELLTLYPFIGTRTNDPAIRRMTTSPYPYLIFYEVTGAELIVHAVRPDQTGRRRGLPDPHQQRAPRIRRASRSGVSVGSVAGCKRVVQTARF
jgi:plasmid stabilization system protein ParE